MPLQLLRSICAGYQTQLIEKTKLASALADAVHLYESGASDQLETITHHISALRELDAQSEELLFAADAAITGKP
ncbi:MAG TPA: hypothetical protein VFV95_19325 [Vicinamibacterales bacterium]|nr:hypothetical protein [Vicinamibacterales bacterium]